MKIEFKQVDFAYHLSLPLFHQLNLELPLHCWVSVTGGFGAGKSTLARLIAGILKPTKGHILYPWNDTEIASTPPFGYLYQNPEDQFVHFNIARELAFNLENLGIPYTQIAEQVEATLRQLGFWERWDHSPTDCSGGEKQRLALAGVLITHPKVLIMDEPTSFLDINAQTDLYGEIKSLLESGISVICITQQEEELYLSDYIVELSAGSVIFTGTTADYIRQKWGKTHS